MPGSVECYDAMGNYGVLVAADRVLLLAIFKTTILTKSSGIEGILLGNVDANSDLPETQEDCLEIFGKNAKVGDYAKVRQDETMGNQSIERYVTDITENEVTWGNPFVLNS